MLALRLLVLAAASAFSLSEANGSSDQLMKALKFMTSGWVALPGFLPELQRPDLREKINRAEIHARLAYVDFAYSWMEREFLHSSADSSSYAIGDICDRSAKKGREINMHGKSLQQLEAIAEIATDQLKQCREMVKQKNKNATLPYFQSLNIHRLDQELNVLATSKKMGRMAAVLLQEPRISLYQTAVFIQNATGGVARGTSWHRDLNMVPLGMSSYTSILTVHVMLYSITRSRVRFHHFCFFLTLSPRLFPLSV